MSYVILRFLSSFVAHEYRNLSKRFLFLTCTVLTVKFYSYLVAKCLKNCIFVLVFFQQWTQVFRRGIFTTHNLTWYECISCLDTHSHQVLTIV